MAYPYLIWAIIMILIPLAMIFVYAFTTGGNSVRTFIFTLDNFAKFFSDKVFIEVLVRSLYNDHYILYSFRLSNSLCYC